MNSVTEFVRVLPTESRKSYHGCVGRVVQNSGEPREGQIWVRLETRPGEPAWYAWFHLSNVKFIAL